MSNYPPGMPGAYATELRFRCENDDCPERGHEWEAPAVNELGGVWLERDEDDCCPECGEQGRQI
jgi:hypothetical protein